MQIQWSMVTMKPSGIGKSVSVANSQLIGDQFGMAKTVTVADCNSNHCHCPRTTTYNELILSITNIHPQRLLCVRVRQSEGRIEYAPQSRARHLRPVSEEGRIAFQR